MPVIHHERHRSPRIKHCGVTTVFLASFPTSQTEWVWKSLWRQWEFVRKLFLRPILNISCNRKNVQNFHFFWLSGRFKGAWFYEQDESWKKDLLDDDRSTFRFSCENWKLLQLFNDAFPLIFVLEPDKTMSQLHFSLAELTLWQFLKNKDTQYVLILSPSTFNWAQHMHSNPCSTANKSLSSDTRKSLLKELGADVNSGRSRLFWSSPFR